MENDKWVWADEDLSPQELVRLDSRLTPIVEWPDVAPESPAQLEQKPAPAVNGTPLRPAAPPPLVRSVAKKQTPPSLVRAIVLHLEGKLEEAIQEIQAGLAAGEPAVELHSAIGALQMELGRYEDAAKNYREVLHREPANATSIHNLEICEEKIT